MLKGYPKMKMLSSFTILRRTVWFFKMTFLVFNIRQTLIQFTFTMNLTR